MKKSAYRKTYCKFDNERVFKGRKNSKKAFSALFVEEMFL